MMIIELKRQHGFCLVDIGTWNFLFFLSSPLKEYKEYILGELGEIGHLSAPL